MQEAYDGPDPWAANRPANGPQGSGGMRGPPSRSTGPAPGWLSYSHACASQCHSIGVPFRPSELCPARASEDLRVRYAAGLVGQLYKSRHFQDVTIHCGSETIGAHSCVLAVSPALKTMLESPMLEGSTRTIHMEDFSAESVEHFLELLYTGAVNSPTARWEDIISMADKYQLPDLIPLCVLKLQQHFSEETAVPYIRVLQRLQHHEACVSAKQQILANVSRAPDHAMKVMQALAEAL